MATYQDDIKTVDIIMAQGVHTLVIPDVEVQMETQSRRIDPRTGHETDGNIYYTQVRHIITTEWKAAEEK